MYLLDTNTVIYYFKNLGHVADRLLSHSPDQIAIPAVVVYELETGIAKSTQPEKRRAQLDTLLRTVAIWPFALAEAQATATLRATLEKAGQPLGPMDYLATWQNCPCCAFNIYWPAGGFPWITTSPILKRTWPRWTRSIPHDRRQRYVTSRRRKGAGAATNTIELNRGAAL